MAKISKLEELKANIPGMLDKFKSMLDSLTGPGKAEITEEALAKESDPLKIKLMEVELLINQLNDIQVIQTRTTHALRNKYGELTKLLTSPKAQQETVKPTDNQEEPPTTRNEAEK